MKSLRLPTAWCFTMLKRGERGFEHRVVRCVLDAPRQIFRSRGMFLPRCPTSKKCSFLSLPYDSPSALSQLLHPSHLVPPPPASSVPAGGLGPASAGFAASVLTPHPPLPQRPPLPRHPASPPIATQHTAPGLAATRSHAAWQAARTRRLAGAKEPVEVHPLRGEQSKEDDEVHEKIRRPNTRASIRRQEEGRDLFACRGKG